MTEDKLYMIFNGEWSTCMPLPFLTVFGMVMALTCDLLTSKPNQFIFVSKCSKIVILVKFPRAVYEISC